MMGSKTGKNNYKRRTISIIVLAFFILALVFVSSAPSYASSIAPKKQKSRAIAIVYDNSGSMYVNDNKAWCQANYAVQVFSAMLNEGDILQIYPMGRIETNGSVYTDAKPVEIKSPNEIETIRNINTPDPNDTPIESITRAYEGIQKVQADEYWLIVLTDGQTFYRNSKELSPADTKKELSTLLSDYNNHLNVIYLGIGNVDAPSINGSFVNSSVSADSSSVPKVLSQMSNLIFGRDELPDANKQGKTITFDIPMSKLILFVQGEGISNVKLTSADGGSTGSIQGSVKPRYSEKGTTVEYYPNSVDSTLQGELVTITDVPSGDYQLEFSGAERSISSYYEPDVDLQVLLYDEEGTIVDPENECAPGKYTMSYGLIDSNGNLVDSPLLGETKYEIFYDINGSAESVESGSAGEIELVLNQEDVLSANASVEFLGGYRIEKDGTDFGWPATGIKIHMPPAALSLEVDVPQHYTILSKIDEFIPITVGVKIDGAPLTDEELAGIDLTIEADGLSFEKELIPGQSAFTLDIINKDAVEAGRYNINITGSGYDKAGNVITAQESDALEFQRYPRWLPWLIGLLLLVLLGTLLILFLNQKRLPKKITIKTCDFNINGATIPGTPTCKYTGKGKKRGGLSIESPKAPSYAHIKCKVSLDLEAISPRRERSPSRKAKIVRVGNTGGAQNLVIAGKPLLKGEDNHWHLATAPDKEATGIKIGNNTVIIIDGTYDGGDSASLHIVLKFS